MEHDGNSFKIEIKEEPVCASGTLTQIKSECEENADFHSETVFVSSHITKESERNWNGSVEIKQEHSYRESKPTEVKNELEPSFADNQNHKETKEIPSQNGGKVAEDASRLHTQSMYRNSSRENCLGNSDPNIFKEPKFLSSSQSQVLEITENSTMDAEVKINNFILKNKTSSQKSSRFLSDLKRHSIFHEDKRQFQCEICKKSFTKALYLKKHKRIHVDRKLYTCELCEKGFKFRSYLRKHNIIHEGKSPYTCDICNKIFTQASNLKQHRLTHEGIRLHACESCGKCFTQSSHLNQHKLIHEGKKPHSCEICCKSFTQTSNLKRHMLSHEGKRPHICDICTKSFAERSKLKRHKLVHESKIAHLGEICNDSIT